MHTKVLQQGEVAATCISVEKGTRKKEMESIQLVQGLGIEGDAHAGAWHRQVSLLAEESVDTMRGRGLELVAGDFAENILTRGIDLKALPLGTLIELGEAVVAVTQIGKKCHNDCEIKRQVGMCVMPTDGIFSVVVKPGTVRPGDVIRVLALVDGE
jgi:cyclic pyranopterin phosphate synthase